LVGFNTTTGAKYIESQTPQHSGEEGIILHTIAAHAATDNLLEEVLCVEGEQVIFGVVEREVFKGDGGEVVFLKFGEVGESG
jgi:hypothetical protein